jgi:Zn-finger nucleic acid-binding protein
MNRINFAGCSGVILDWCKEHGTWFDQKELQQVVTFIRAGGLKKSRDREKENLRAEQQRLREQQRALMLSEARLGTAAHNENYWREEPESFLHFLSGVWGQLRDK